MIQAGCFLEEWIYSDLRARAITYRTLPGMCIPIFMAFIQILIHRTKYIYLLMAAYTGQMILVLRLPPAKAAMSLHSFTSVPFPPLIQPLPWVACRIITPY